MCCVGKDVFGLKLNNAAVIADKLAAQTGFSKMKLSRCSESAVIDAPAFSRVGSGRV